MKAALASSTMTKCNTVKLMKSMINTRKFAKVHVMKIGEQDCFIRGHPWFNLP